MEGGNTQSEGTKKGHNMIDKLTRKKGKRMSAFLGVPGGGRNLKTKRRKEARQKHGLPRKGGY